MFLSLLPVVPLRGRWMICEY